MTSRLARTGSVPGDGDADGAAVFDQDAIDSDAGADDEVATSLRRLEVADCRGTASTVPCRRLVDTDALLAHAVEVGVERQSGLLSRLDEDARQAVRRRSGHAERAPIAVEGRTEEVIVLRAQEIGLHLVEGPAGAAKANPTIIVRRTSPGEHLGIDRGAAAEHAPLRIDDDAIGRVSARNGFEPPRQGPLGHLEEADRHMDIGIGVARTGLEQKHARGLVLAQPCRQDAARRTASDHDVVVVSHRPGLLVDRVQTPGWHPACRP